MASKPQILHQCECWGSIYRAVGRVARKDNRSISGSRIALLLDCGYGGDFGLGRPLSARRLSTEISILAHHETHTARSQPSRRSCGARAIAKAMTSAPYSVLILVRCSESSSEVATTLGFAKLDPF